MNVLSLDKKIEVAAALVDGMSIRATQRITGADKKTIMRLALALGRGCARLHDTKMRGLRCNLIQMDEIWSYIHTKNKRVTEESPPDAGDQWTFTAIDVNSRAIVSYVTGRRSAENAKKFLADLRMRVVGRPTISSDGYKPYIDAVEEAYGADVDFGMLVKQYQGKNGKVVNQGESKQPSARYKGAVKLPVKGAPDLTLINTSYVERSNLTLRMGQRRFARRTNAFSKSLDSHCAAIALHHAHYNFCRVHQTLRITPAMALGIESHVWSLGELFAAAVQQEPTAADAPLSTPDEPPTTPDGSTMFQASAPARKLLPERRPFGSAGHAPPRLQLIKADSVR